jgi:hypothetical protein
MGSSNLDIRGEGDGPITTVLFPDDYLVSGGPSNQRLTAPATAIAAPPTADPGRSGGPFPWPPLAQGRSLEGTGAQQSTLSMPAK